MDVKSRYSNQENQHRYYTGVLLSMEKYVSDILCLFLSVFVVCVCVYVCVLVCACVCVCDCVCESV